jgi:hypothetical protein
MSINLFTNNASSLLASSITNVSTTLALTPATGTLFPSPGAGQIAVVTCEDVSGNLEIMWCTGRSGDNLTVTRAQEGTAAIAFASGSRVELRVTAGILTQALQKNGGDTLAGTTNLSGILALGGGGSIQGGEYAAGFVRSAAGATAGQIFVNGSGVPKSGTATILTDANLIANLPAGYGLLSTGMVLAWYGSSGSIPSGYHLCDGTASTPNLTDKFIVGAGGTYAPAFGNSGGSGTVSFASAVLGGSSAAFTLTSNEMPSHRHRLRASGGGGITASATITNAAAYGLLADASGGHADGPFDDTTHPGGIAWVENTGGGAGHSHSLTGGTVSGSVAYVPPYVGLFYIMKT